MATASNKQKTDKLITAPERLSRGRLLIFAVVFAILGSIILIKSFAAPNPALPGDLNNDNTVNITDMSILLSNYGTTNSSADINGDGSVNVLDMSLLLSHYGQTITAAKPSIPTGLTATPGNGTVTLKWNANPTSDSVDAYQVYWTTDSTWAAAPQQNLNVTGTSFTVTGLTNGTTYHFRVSAHNAAGYGDWSSTAVNATPIGSGSPVLWSANAENGNLSSWSSIQDFCTNKSQPPCGDRIVNVSNQVRSGSRAYEFHVKSTDENVFGSGLGAVRAEVTKSPVSGMGVDGKDTYVSFSYYFPFSTAPYPNNEWNFFHQIHDNLGGTQANAAYIYNNNLMWKVWSGPTSAAVVKKVTLVSGFQANSWYDFVLHYHWGSSATTGYIEAWVQHNGVASQVVPHTAAGTMYSGSSGLYLKAGWYIGSKVDVAAYGDNYAMSDNYASAVSVFPSWSL